MDERCHALHVAELYGSVLEPRRDLQPDSEHLRGPRVQCGHVRRRAIGVAFTLGEEPEQVVRCPVCGHRFVLGHGHRRD
ncbi:hypothetical protein AB0N23_00365 [Streptomyces sp. NPDC052644]